jgi:Flp pilus assembly protein TadB
MATRMYGHTRLTVRAVPLNHREYEYLAMRYRALRQAGIPVVRETLGAVAVVAAALVIAGVFIAIGAPWWLAAAFGIVGAAIPPIAARRNERRRTQKTYTFGEAA